MEQAVKTLGKTPVEPVIRSSSDALLDQIDVPLYAVSAAGVCVRANPACERLLGYSQAEMLGADMHALVHSRYPDGRAFPASECPLLQARSAGRAMRGVQEVLWAKDGSAVPVECSAAPAVMEDGRTGAVVTLKDLRAQRSVEAHSVALEVEQAEVLRQRDAMARIERDAAAAETSRQREVQMDVERIAAAQLREQLAEVEAVYASAPTALSLVDARTMRYLRVNLQYAELMGVPMATMVGSAAGAYTEGDGGGVLRRALAGESVRNELREMKVLSDPAEDHFFLLNATPNRNAQGEVETISLAIVDVTGQKRAENALVQADKLAAVGRLAASISHEINNPLEAVTNLLYLVHQDPALSPESTGYVEIAEAELARVSQIASQTLRFHRHAVKPVMLTPEQVVEPVVALYQGRLKNSRVRVRVEHCGNGDKMVVHEGDVRQILNNLLGNAIDAMPQGGTVTVRTRPARCARTRNRGTRISITDTGHGMSRETALHVFEPFFTTKGSSGSGLGLWISHTLARRHGGELQVRSRQGGEKSGTVFSLFLPNLTTSEAQT